MFAPFLFAAMQVSTSADIGYSELSSTVTVSGPCVRGCESGQMSIGAGEIVGRRSDGKLLVLTARHVVENAGALAVFVRNGAQQGIDFKSFSQRTAGRRATVVAYAANIDLALVAFRPVRSDDYSFAPLSDVKFGKAKAGVVVGDPNGSLWTISGYSFLTGDDATFDLSCSTCGPGDSGGGVFDADGKLLGIVVQQAVKNDAASSLSQRFQAIALPEMRQFLTFAGFDASMSGAEAGADSWKRFDDTRSASSSGASTPPAPPHKTYVRTEER